MSTETSIGPDAQRGGNEDHGNADGCGNKTLGDKAAHQPPAGAGIVEDTPTTGGAPGKSRERSKDNASGQEDH